MVATYFELKKGIGIAIKSKEIMQLANIAMPTFITDVFRHSTKHEHFVSINEAL